MKRNILFGSMALLAGSLIVANASPQDDVAAAAKALGDKDNYSWTATVTAPEGGGGFRGGNGPTQGKAQKDGLTWVSMTGFNDTTTEGVIKGDKIAVKTEEGWQSADEAGGGDGGFNPGMFMARRMQAIKAPAVEAAELAAAAKEIKKEDDVYSGDLTEDGAKARLSFGRGRRGGGGDGGGPAISGAKGSVKFWVKDGVLTKYEYKVQGKIDFNGNEIDMDRTTTVEIKDVGTTKIDVPEDAKKKLS